MLPCGVSKGVAIFGAGVLYALGIGVHVALFRGDEQDVLAVAELHVLHIAGFDHICKLAVFQRYGGGLVSRTAEVRGGGIDDDGQEQRPADQGYDPTPVAAALTACLLYTSRCV